MEEEKLAWLLISSEAQVLRLLELPLVPLSVYSLPLIFLVFYPRDMLNGPRKYWAQGPYDWRSAKIAYFKTTV